jgi:hypothetical protein
MEFGISEEERWVEGAVGCAAVPVRGRSSPPPFPPHVAAPAPPFLARGPAKPSPRGAGRRG